MSSSGRAVTIYPEHYNINFNISLDNLVLIYKTFQSSYEPSIGERHTITEMIERLVGYTLMTQNFTESITDKLKVKDN